MNWNFRILNFPINAYAVSFFIAVTSTIGRENKENIKETGGDFSIVPRKMTWMIWT